MHVHLPLYAAQCFVDASQNGDYGACVAAVDWALAVIVDELKKQDLYENTILMFTSDNGSRGGIGQDFYDPDRPIAGPSNAPLRGSKNTSWEGGQRVPFIFSWPAGLQPALRGTVTSAMAANLDLLPTLAHLIGTDLLNDQPIDGCDLSGVLLTGTASPRQNFVYFGSGPAADAGSPLEAIRSGHWKLHLYRKGQAVNELYNLDEDLSENHNRSDQHPDIVRELTELAGQYADPLGDLNRNQKGQAVRSCRIVDNPQTLTRYDPDHPYIIALYDKSEAG